jgi:uncharacterized membrane protein YgcG
MMKCPQCVQKIHRAAEICPHCGFSLATMDARCGGSEVMFHCLEDTAGVLRREERQGLEETMERFGRRFPQLFMAIYTGSLGEASDVRPFGFWLLNRAVLADLPGDKSSEGGIFLVLDPQRKAAGIVFGYLLDPFLDEMSTFECLSRAHSYWLEGQYAVGMQKVICHLEGILMKRCRQARRNSEVFRRKVYPKVMGGDSMRAVAVGHGAEAAPAAAKEVSP